MIIERLDLIAFGRFCDVSLDLSAGPARFHLIYGPNESGKTTSLRAISALLFGIPHQTDDNYVHSYTQLRVGGKLRRGDEVLDCIRRKGKRATLRGPDDAAIEEVLLERMLGGITADDFSSRFGLTHEELVTGGSAILSGQGDLSAILFSAGLGIGRLSEVQQTLESATQKLFKPNGKIDVINQGCKLIETLKAELRECQVLPTHFQELKRELVQLQADAKQTSQRVATLNEECQRLRIYRHAIPIVAEWKTAQRAFTELKHVPDLDASFNERRLQAEQQRSIARARLGQVNQRLAIAREAFEALAGDAKWLDHEAEIEAVYQSAIARNESQAKAVSLREEQRHAERRMLELLAGLSIDVDSIDPASDADGFAASVGPLQITESKKSRLRELAAQYERLLQQKEDASDELEMLRQRLETLDDELSRFDGVPDPHPLSQLIDAMGPPRAVLETLTRECQIRERNQQAVATALCRLPGFGGTAAEAANLRLPSAEAIQAVASELESLTNELADVDSELRDLQQNQQSIVGRLARLAGGETLPTDEELQTARAARDERVRELSLASAQDSLLPIEFESLRDAIAKADRLVDTIREHHEQVHERASLQRKHDQGVRALSATSAVQAERTEQLRGATERWNELWRACGVEPQGVAAMQRWLQDHERFVESYEKYQEANRNLTRTAARLEQDASRLRLALRGCGEPAVEMVAEARGGSLAFVEPESSVWDGELETLAQHPVLGLYDEAIASRNRLVEMRSRYDTLVDRRDEATAQRAAVQTQLKSRTSALDKWYRDWNDATATWVAHDDTTPNVVLSMLDQIDRVMETKRKRDDIIGEIAALEAATERHRCRLERLLEAIAEPLDDGDAYYTIQRLYQRLKEERGRVKQRQAVAAQITGLEAELQEIEDDSLRAQIALDQLCCEAGCSQADQLASVEQQSMQRRHWSESIRSLETQLHQLAAGSSMDDFIDEVSRHHVEPLEDRCRQLEVEIAETQQQLEDVQRAVGAKEGELKRIDGSDRASELRQSIQVELGHLAQVTREYARLKIAAVMLQQAMEHYRRENQGPVLNKAEHYFERLTCGEYEHLKVDFDTKGRPSLLGVRGQGPCREVPATAMSSGTADALYLALRLASLVHQMEQGKPFPLIIDDCLVQMDDRRSAAALAVFSEVSEKTQIILYTHHRHLIELAEANLPPDGFHVHEL